MQGRTLSTIIWVVALQLIAFVLGHITQNNMVWYHLLNKSSLTPHSGIFSIVWFLLYCLLGIIGSFLWRHREHPQVKTLWHLFLLQLVLNWLWTPVFFHSRNILGGLIILLAMIILTAMFIIKAYRNDFSRIALWMIPYLLWCMFAYYLNLVIWLNNC